MFSLTQCNACSIYYTLIFLVTLSWMLSQENASAKPCAYFSFENATVRANSVEVTENTTITLMFYLKDKNCSNMENNVISIQRMDVMVNAPQCNIVLKNDACRNTTQKDVYCICRDTFRAYSFSKTVSKSDFTRWKWSTTNGLADDVYIWFNETSIEDQTLSAASSTRTFDLSSSNTVDEERQRSITIAVVAYLIIISICLVALIIMCKQKRSGKTMKSVAKEDNTLDDMGLNKFIMRTIN